jgi:hypothetical protein
MIVTFGATAGRKGGEGEKPRGRKMINIERLSPAYATLMCALCRKYLTVDVEKHSLAHSWWNVVFRNAEICAQVSTIDAGEAQ